MCLALIAHHTHPRYRLILAANRDEFYERPTAAAAFWADDPNVLAGRDLEKGGTWLGVTRSGRIAVVTNYREGGANRADARSRGLLVSGFLQGEERPAEYLEKLRPDDSEYNGYNLVVGDGDDLYYHSNRTGEILQLHDGVYGLSNDLLDTPWPKVKRSKETLFGLLELDGAALIDGMFDMLADHSRPEDGQLPDTGIGIEWERLLSAAFIVSPDYGSRSSTVVLLDKEGRGTFVERSFGPDGAEGGTAAYQFVTGAKPFQHERSSPP